MLSVSTIFYARKQFFFLLKFTRCYKLLCYVKIGLKSLHMYGHNVCNFNRDTNCFENNVFRKKKKNSVKAFTL